MAREKCMTIGTNENCIGCNKCVSNCPVLGANVSKNNNRILVSDKCISCGVCFGTCNHSARYFVDDTEKFFADLEAGKDISVIVDPAFKYNFGEKAVNILGFLREKGVNVIYDMSHGAEISLWAHAKYVKEHDSTKILANTCSAVIKYIQNCNPELLDIVIPVASYAECMAIYARKYLKNNDAFAYLSPCIAAATNCDIYYKNISYGLTFDSLYKYIGDTDISNLSAQAVFESEGFGKLISFFGGFREGLSILLGREKTFLSYNNSINEIKKMLNSFYAMDSSKRPTLITTNICKHGCAFGYGNSKSNLSMETALMQYTKDRIEVYKIIEKFKSGEELFDAVCNYFSELNLEDFLTDFSDRYKQEYTVPEQIIENIFSDMHKNTFEKQTINCGACGYSSCREMVIAVANGYSRIQNCNHYMNDDLIIKSMMDMQFDVLNSHGFNRNIERLVALNPDTKYVVALGNINKLRSVNELYGKNVGDNVLRYIAKTFTDFVADRGCVSRYGGSIFALCFEYSEENVEMFVNRKYFDCSHLGVGFPITMRFGMIVIDGHDQEKIARASDMAAFACDKANDKTRNVYTLFSDDMKKGLDMENQVTNDMRNAMENQEYVLYLQPQYDSNTGKLVGAESLCRWIKKDGSIVSPGVFIPIFEKNGFIKELDRYIWESAFKLVKKWEDQGIEFVPVSVNVSRMSMTDSQIVTIIKELSDKYKINKSKIHFEITESAYMENQISIASLTQQIRDLGYIIAMDDFGSGYSSLNSLKDIPFDILKLDMGFLRGSKNSEKGGSIIGHMIHMAHTLDLVTVAEGVETKEQVDMLSEMGCDIIQGYYYSKPVPLEEYENMLVKYNG